MLSSQDGSPPIELLMYGLPHHLERLRTQDGSSNRVLEDGCTPTIHVSYYRLWC